MDEFLYKIVPEPAQSPPDFNFAIWMDSRFAKKVLKRKISQKNHDWAQRWGKWVIYSCGLKIKDEYLPYEFIEEKGNLTYLLKSIELPGEPKWDVTEGILRKDSGRLDFSSNGISEDVKDIKYGEVYYHSKNVENMEHAHILLMLWLEWFNLYYFLPKK